MIRLWANLDARNDFGQGWITLVLLYLCLFNALVEEEIDISECPDSGATNLTCNVLHESKV